MKKHIIFTGGGTGGHVYPAIAIIENLKKEGYDISWIGSKKGIEYKIVKGLGLKFYSIPSGKLRRYFSFQNFIDIFKIFIGFVASVVILIKVRPNLIFSKGGYVTVPPIIASKMLKIRSVTHESDFTPGLATRINSKFVDRILVPYNETQKYFKGLIKDKVVVTGNPVREDFFNPSMEKGKDIMGFKTNKPTILVLGGSLGAKEINDVVLAAKDDLTEKYNVYHQMGENNYIEIEEDSYKSIPFINNSIADVIKATDLVISRAGAGAIWEFATVGVPSLLIPLTVGTRGDQVFNADYFVNKGISLKLSGSDVNKQNLLNVIDNYFNKTKKEMVGNVSTFKNSNSVDNICRIIKELI